MRWMALALLLAGCSKDDGEKKPFTFDWPANPPELRGGGGPAVTFSADELGEPCAVLDVEDDTFKHRNLVALYRGHLVMPWAPEWGSGGLAFFDVSDPCKPRLDGEGLSKTMRESHAIGFVRLPDNDPHAGDYAVVSDQLGIQIWDITEVTAPEQISKVKVPGVLYPDAYARVPLSVFVQYPYVYAAVADNGVAIFDIQDPAEPFLVDKFVFRPGLRAGGVFAFGTTLFVSAAKEVGQAVLDISNPTAPLLRPGGRFDLIDEEGIGTEPYHSNFSGGHALFARKSGGGGPIVYDLFASGGPAWAGEYKNSGSGGYVFFDEGYLFQGEGSFGQIYEAKDFARIAPMMTVELAGDLDTVTPFGNVAIVAVDDDAENGEGTVVTPWSKSPDRAAPEVLRIDPADGADGVAVTAIVGIGFNEMIEPSTVFPGSIQLHDADGNAVDGWGSAQEGIASYAPKKPLEPGMTYVITVKAGGVTDANGNAVDSDVVSEFTTAR